MSTITERLLKALILNDGGVLHISKQRNDSIIEKMKSGQFPSGEIGDYIQKMLSHRRFDWSIDGHYLIALYFYGELIPPASQINIFNEEYLRRCDKGFRWKMITGEGFDILVWKDGEAEPMRWSKRLTYTVRNGNTNDILSIYHSMDDVIRKRAEGAFIVKEVLNRSDIPHEEKCIFCEKIINDLIFDLGRDNTFKTRETSYGTIESAMLCNAPKYYAKYLAENSDIVRASYIYQIAYDAGFEDGTKGGYLAQLQKLQRLM